MIPDEPRLLPCLPLTYKVVGAWPAGGWAKDLPPPHTDIALPPSKPAAGSK